MSTFTGMPVRAGHVVVIAGPMFSGKTTELIRRIKRAQIGRQKVQIFKPAIDKRYHETEVVTHSALSVKAQPVNSSVEILQHVYDNTHVVAIDEAQFFDDNIQLVVEKLARRGFHVICAGLDQDSNGKVFGQMGSLLAISDEQLKLKAVCTICGADATKTYRKNSNNTDQVLVGEADLYEARCRAHWDCAEEGKDQLAFFVNLSESHSQTPNL